MAELEIELSVTNGYGGSKDTRIVRRTVAIGDNDRFVAWELQEALKPIVKGLVREFGDPNDRPANR